MLDGWLLLLLVLGLLTFGGTWLVFWLMRSTADHRESEVLNAADLRLLEESVQALVARLKAATDEAVAEITERQVRLQAVLDRADAVLGATEPPRAPEMASGLDMGLSDGLAEREIRRLADDGVAEADIARRAGLSRGEVELILEMQAARR